MTCFVCANSPVGRPAPLPGFGMSQDCRGQGAGLLGMKADEAGGQDLADLDEAVVGGHVVGRERVWALHVSTGRVRCCRYRSKATRPPETGHLRSMGCRNANGRRTLDLVAHNFVHNYPRLNQPKSVVQLGEFMARKSLRIGPSMHKLIEDARVDLGEVLTLRCGDDGDFRRLPRHRSVKLQAWRHERAL